MTHGIQVLWPNENGNLDEIEYFCWIDVECLYQIPEFTTVPVVWHGMNAGPSLSLHR